MSELVVGVDVGTSTAHLAVHGPDRCLARTSRALATRYPAADRVEQDAHALTAAVVDGLGELLAQAGVAAADIAAIGLTCQRGTLVAWDTATGQALAPAIGWQDRRTAPRVAELQAMGIPVSTLLAGLKMEWLLAENAAVGAARARGTLRFGTVDDWLTWSLSGGTATGTDPSNAIATGLFDVREGGWNPMALELFGLEPGLLGPVVATAEVVGTTASDVAGAAVPLAARIGDQQASFAGFGLGEGDANLTLGTSAMTDLGIGEDRRHAPEGTFLLPLWSVPGDDGPVTSYCFEGSVLAAGAAVEWLVRVGALDAVDLLDDVAASGRLGPIVVPAFAGLGAPHDRPDARAAITGIGFDTTSADLVRATLLGIAHRCAEFADLLDVGATVHVDGGLSQSRVLLQAIADVADRTLLVAAEPDVSARGAARLAAAAPDVDAAVPAVPVQAEPVRPTWSAAQREEAAAAFVRAVRSLDAG